MLSRRYVINGTLSRYWRFPKSPVPLSLLSYQSSFLLKIVSSSGGLRSNIHGGLGCESFGNSKPTDVYDDMVLRQSG